MKLRTAAGGLALSGAVACAVWTGRSGGILVGRWQLLVVLIAWSASAVLASVLLRGAGRWTAAGVLGIAVVLQGVALTSGPQLSDDLYRYIWDGQVAASGTDPYAYPPDAPQLTGLREPFLWPDDPGCTTPRSALPRTARANPFAGDQRGAGCTQINRPSVRTIYPPAAELAFRAGNALVPTTARELRAQVPAALESLALSGLLVLLLARARRPLTGALLYAAGPLAALEAGMDGHVDVLAALLGVGVVAALGRERVRVGAAALAGALLALAALVKLYPAILGAAVLPRIGVRSRASAALVAAGLGTCVLLYAPHVAAVGLDVVGYLPGYLAENGYSSGNRYWLLGWLHLGSVTALIVAVGLVALVAWSLLRPVVGEGIAPVAARVCTVLGGAMVLTTPGNAWYCSLLIGCAVLAARPEWVTAVVANYVVYVDHVVAARSQWPLVAWYVCLGTVLFAAFRRRRVTGR